MLRRFGITGAKYNQFEGGINAVSSPKRSLRGVFNVSFTFNFR